MNVNFSFKPSLKTKLGIALALLVSAVGLTQLFGPELHEWNVRRELQSAGVRPLKLPTLAGLDRNHCEDRHIPKRADGTYDPASCTCLLLLHGVGDSSLTWRRILELPTSDWHTPPRILALDLPGSGDSPAPKDSKDYRARTLARILKQELRALPECRRWAVAGNSFGGWVAAWMFVDESTTPTPGGAWMDRLALIDSAGMKLSEDSGNLDWIKKGGIEALQEFQARAYHSPRPLPASAWRAAAARLEKSSAKQILAAQSPEERLDTFLPQLKRPTLVFWGKSDRIIPLEAGRAMASLVPGALYREAPQCGHLPQKECPKALVKALQELIFFGSL